MKSNIISHKHFKKNNQVQKINQSNNQENKQNQVYNENDINTQRILIEKNDESPIKINQQSIKKQIKQCPSTKKQKNVISLQHFRQLITKKKSQIKIKNNSYIKQYKLKTQQIKPFNTRLKQIIFLQQPKNFIWMNLLIILWIPFNFFDLYFGFTDRDDCLNHHYTLMNLTLRKWFLSTGFIGLLNLILVFLNYLLRLFVLKAKIYENIIFFINFFILTFKSLIFDWIGYSDYFKLQQKNICDKSIPTYVNARLIFQCIVILLLITWLIIYIVQNRCFKDMPQKYKEKKQKKLQSPPINT